MPKHGNVGYSDNTPHKQDHFRVLLETHMPIVQSIIARHPWVEPAYLYLDLNAGPGRYTVQGQAVYGSPLIACAVAQQVGVPTHALLCEQGDAELEALDTALIEFGLSHTSKHAECYSNRHSLSVTVCPGAYQTTAQGLLRQLQTHADKAQYGLIYSDENGSLPPFPLLAAYAQTLPYLDLVIHVAASPIKWQRVSPIHPLTGRLDEFLSTIPKRYWLTRQPYGRHQWTFLIGTNWQAFPVFRRQGFWPVNSPEGASILRTLSLTTKERQAHIQLNLFPPEAV